MTAEVTTDGRTVWVNDLDGMNIGRFSPLGIDVHHGLEAQFSTGQQCLFCKPGRPGAKRALRADWELFITKMKEHHGVDVPAGTLTDLE